MTNHQSDSRLYYAIALSGITCVIASSNATRNPGLVEITTTIGMVFVFLMLVKAAIPESGVTDD